MLKCIAKIFRGHQKNKLTGEHTELCNVPSLFFALSHSLFFSALCLSHCLSPSHTLSLSPLFSLHLPLSLFLAPWLPPCLSPSHTLSLSPLFSLHLPLSLSLPPSLFLSLSLSLPL